MYDLVDSLTYKSRRISPNMWPVFELTYKLFKAEAIDFLDGRSHANRVQASIHTTACSRNVAFAG